MANLLKLGVSEVGDLDLLIDNRFAVILGVQGRPSLGSFELLLGHLLFVDSLFLVTVELLHPVRHEFVVLSHIPLLGVVDFDLVEHHLANVLERIDFVLHLFPLVANLIHMLVDGFPDLSLNLFDFVLFQKWRAVFP